MTPRTRRPARPLDIDALLRDPQTRIIVACGAGGVGKTTTSAALALRAALAGRRTVVLTIDPARRLAQALGLTELDNTPRLVNGVAAVGDVADGGELFAMMLDMKRTFDEVVSAHSTPDRAEQIFANPFYQALSTSFAGTQEYMAMEKLSQLAEQDEWDLIIVDTPPSRSALDFLDAPQRLGRFLDGRLIRLLAMPAKAGLAGGKAYLKVVTASFAVLAKAVTKILGGDLLRDVSSFVGSLEAMFGGFRERADHTYRLLKAPGTAFIVVASPEPDALREASYFVERLEGDQMPLAGLVLNRVHHSAPTPEGLSALSAAHALAAADALAAKPATATRNLAQAALRVQAELAATADNDARMMRRFVAAHPDVAVVAVAALPNDVHDLAGLAAIGEQLGSR